MKNVSISGWEIGFKKVEHTKLLMSKVGLSLSQAKQATDDVLAGNVVTVPVPDDQYDQIVAELVRVGAKLQKCAAP